MKKLMLAFAFVCMLVVKWGESNIRAAIVQYDISGAPDRVTSLPPVYIAGAGQVVHASSLTAVGMNIADDSNLEGPGDFIFDGFTGNWWTPRNPGQYFETTLTAKTALALGEMKYTFFSGLWSNRGSIRRMQVFASTDGFITEQFIAEHSWFPQTTPFELNNPNDFVDSLNGLKLSPGQTVSIRFFPFNPDYGDIPAGFWNKGESDYNLSISVTPVPEPSTLFIGLALLGLAGVSTCKRGQ